MKKLILPCGLCAGDGYSPFNILKICPDCDGEGTVTIYRQDEVPADIISQSITDSESEPHNEDDYDPIPF